MTSPLNIPLIYGEKKKIFSIYSSSWGLNLPERDSLTSPGESLVSVFSVVTVLHVLVLTLYFLPAVAILSLGGNKKMLSCQTTQCNDMKYLPSTDLADTRGSNWTSKKLTTFHFSDGNFGPRLIRPSNIFQKRRNSIIDSSAFSLKGFKN